MTDFFSEYISYTSDTEVPIFFHRWAAIATIGALLSRNMWFQHGHFTVYPNIYCMLMGKPASRKSTAIKMIKNLVKEIGYDHIAADKTTKEKFILDLSGTVDGQTAAEDVMNDNLWGNSLADTTSISEMFIMADEFDQFFGNNILDFVSLLGNFWDYIGVFENKVKNSSSVKIPNPTVSILGGTTPTTFSAVFPPEIIGQGFFSRLIIVHSDPSEKKISFPEEPPLEKKQQILKSLFDIRNTVYGKVELTAGARKLLDRIYTTQKVINDVRFEHYANRRFTHLLKLCLVHLAAFKEKQITEDIVIYTNTVLSHTEHLMPKALGEFGKSKHADTTHRVLSIIENNKGITEVKEIWKMVHNDLESMAQLGEILKKLLAADKIQSVPKGFLPKIRMVEEKSTEFVDYSLLTEEERRYLK